MAVKMIVCVYVVEPCYNCNILIIPLQVCYIAQDEKYNAFNMFK